MYSSIETTVGDKAVKGKDKYMSRDSRVAKGGGL